MLSHTQLIRVLSRTITKLILKKFKQRPIEMFDWENTFSSNKVDKEISFMNEVLNTSQISHLINK